MPVQRLLVVGVGIAEQLVEPRHVVAGRGDQPVEVVMPDLVAEVAQQGAVRLVHLDPQLLAVHVVALGQIDCDDPVFVAGQHLLVRTGQQPESQAVVGILITADDRQLQLVQLGDQPRLAASARANSARPAVSASLGRSMVSAHDAQSPPG